MPTPPAHTLSHRSIRFHPVSDTATKTSHNPLWSPLQVRSLLDRNLKKAKRRWDEKTRVSVTRAITQVSDEFYYPPALCFALIQTESGFNTHAVSNMGAIGLTQVIPETGHIVARQHHLPWNGPDTLLDPERNVVIGITYLHDLDIQFEDIDLALTAYNRGPGRVSARTGPSGYARLVERWEQKFSTHL